MAISGFTDSDLSYTLLPGETHSETYTFPEDTGLYTIQIEPGGGYKTWIVESNCTVDTTIVAPAVSLGDPPTLPAPSQPDVAELPTTGSNTGMNVALGLALVGLGSGAVFASRRRRA